MECMQKLGVLPKETQIKAILPVLRTQARLNCGTGQVYHRFGTCDGRFYIDLGDESFNVVEVNRGIMES